MNFDPINLPSLLNAIVWPAVAFIALVAFRKPLGQLVGLLGQRVQKIAVAGVSLELAKASELKPPALDTDIRQLEAGLRPQSGPLDLLAQIRAEGQYDYIVIDLGSESRPRWLSSRLYLFALLLSRVGWLKCFVFLETANGVRNRFIGLAPPDAICWTLARRYPWFEYAYAQAYVRMGLPQFDLATNSLSESEASLLVQQFLAAIRTSGPIALPFPDPNHPPQTIDLGNGILEYADWIDGGRLERLLGTELSVASITVAPHKSSNKMSAAVLRQQGRFVAILKTDRTFRSLIDRSAVLESLAAQWVRQASDGGT